MRCHIILQRKQQPFYAHMDRRRVSISAMVHTNTRWSYPHECIPWYEQPVHESMDLSPRSPNTEMTKWEKPNLYCDFLAFLAILMSKKLRLYLVARLNQIHNMQHYTTVPNECTISKYIHTKETEQQTKRTDYYFHIQINLIKLKMF